MSLRIPTKGLLQANRMPPLRTLFGHLHSQTTLVKYKGIPKQLLVAKPSRCQGIAGNKLPEHNG